MRKWARAFAASAVVVGYCLWTVAARAAERPDKGPTREDASVRTIEVAVVVGGHGGGKPFFDLFQGHDHVRCQVVQLKDDSEIFEDITKWSYDVIVLYNLSGRISDNRRANFKSLMGRGLGVVALHHAFSSYQDWPEFSKIIGGRSFLRPTEIDGRSIRTGEKAGNRYTLRVVDANHPVTRGVRDFELVDETYFNYHVEPDSAPLLTTDASGSDKVVGWAHTYGRGRAVYIQAGHGPSIFQPEHTANKEYRRLLAQAIRWTNQGVGSTADGARAR